jgi:hypothetical protein
MTTRAKSETEVLTAVLKILCEEQWAAGIMGDQERCNRIEVAQKLLEDLRAEMEE